MQFCWEICFNRELIFFICFVLFLGESKTKACSESFGEYEVCMKFCWTGECREPLWIVSDRTWLMLLKYYLPESTLQIRAGSWNSRSTDSSSDNLKSMYIWRWNFLGVQNRLIKYVDQCIHHNSFHIEYV